MAYIATFVIQTVNIVCVAASLLLTRLAISSEFCKVAAMSADIEDKLSFKTEFAVEMVINEA